MVLFPMYYRQCQIQKKKTVHHRSKICPLCNPRKFVTLAGEDVESIVFMVPRLSSVSVVTVWVLSTVDGTLPWMSSGSPRITRRVNSPFWTACENRCSRIFLMLLSQNVLPSGRKSSFCDGARLPFQHWTICQRLAKCVIAYGHCSLLCHNNEQQVLSVSEKEEHKVLLISTNNLVLLYQTASWNHQNLYAGNDAWNCHLASRTQFHATLFRVTDDSCRHFCELVVPGCHLLPRQQTPWVF